MGFRPVRPRAAAAAEGGLSASETRQDPAGGNNVFGGTGSVRRHGDNTFSRLIIIIINEDARLFTYTQPRPVKSLVCI